MQQTLARACFVGQGFVTGYFAVAIRLIEAPINSIAVEIL
jgi:hypothetical protein